MWRFSGRLRLAWLWCLLASGACSDLPRPFQPEPDSKELSRDLTDPRRHPQLETAELVVLPPKGVTEAMAERLPIAIVLGLREQGIVATTNANGAPHTIEVTGKPQQVKDELRIAWIWTVRDAKGAVIGRHEHTVSAKPDEWVDGNDRLVSRVASRGAYYVAEMMGRADPANAPVGARTTVLPPTEVPPAGGAPGPVTPASILTPPPTPGGAPPVTAPPTPASAAAKFPRVRVVTVTGAPGNGNRALTTGMRRALGESQIVLVDAPDGNAMTVIGSVEISKPADGKQRIIIRWVLKGPGGEQLGDLEQANDIKAGALDADWGGVANVIALAASEGILELIRRGAPPR